MNRQIGVVDSKNVIVFDPLLTGHVIRRMLNGLVRIFNGNQRETLGLVTHERIVVGFSNLLAGLGTWTAMYENCLRLNGQRSRSQGYAQEIYAVKDFGDARE